MTLGGTGLGGNSPTIYALEALGQVVTGGNTVNSLSGNRYTQTSQALADLSSSVSGWDCKGGRVRAVIGLVTCLIMYWHAAVAVLFMSNPHTLAASCRSSVFRHKLLTGCRMCYVAQAHQL